MLFHLINCAPTTTNKQAFRHTRHANKCKLLSDPNTKTPRDWRPKWKMRREAMRSSGPLVVLLPLVLLLITITDHSRGLQASEIDRLRGGGGNQLDVQFKIATKDRDNSLVNSAAPVKQVAASLHPNGHSNDEQDINKPPLLIDKDDLLAVEPATLSPTYLNLNNEAIRRRNDKLANEHRHDQIDQSPSSPAVAQGNQAEVVDRLKTNRVTVSNKQQQQPQQQQQQVQSTDSTRPDTGSDASRLADYVATGTTAGLLFNDLMAQAAHMQSQEPATYDNEDEAPDVDINGPIGSYRPPLMADHQSPEVGRPRGRLEQDDLSMLGPGGGGGGGSTSAGDGEQRLAQPTVDAEQYGRQQLEMFASDQLKSNGGEQMGPDNMESLMRSEGEAPDGNEESATSSNNDDENENSNVANGQQQQQQQDRAASNGNRPMSISSKVINQGATALPLQSSGFVGADLIGSGSSGERSDNGGDNDDADDDDDDGNGRQVDERKQLTAPIFYNTADGLISNNGVGPAMGQTGIGRQDFGGSLAVPNRDSLDDLNAAAGHYYGKKKKKKIIIKKKKKVIKKKKKVKIVKKYKIKKKKKKKKKPKKMMHHDHGKYYMYAKVPKKKMWEFGFKKGNEKHWIERHEKGHKNKFKTKVKWFDKKSKGKGFHIWDYNHHDKKKKKKHH